jgi:hypothetical protein
MATMTLTGLTSLMIVRMGSADHRHASVAIRGKIRHPTATNGAAAITTIIITTTEAEVAAEAAVRLVPILVSGSQDPRERFQASHRDSCTNWSH